MCPNELLGDDTNGSHSRARLMIREILNNPVDEDDVTNQLLGEFQSGFPVRHLRELLASPNERVVGLGTYIAAELGGIGAPLLDLASSLLSHPRKNVRILAIRFVLNSASSS